MFIAGAVNGVDIMNDNGNGKLLTIKEAAYLTGMSLSGLYKHISLGVLPVEHCGTRGKEIKKVKELDLIRVYGCTWNTVEHSRIQINTPVEHSIPQENTIEHCGTQIIEYDKISDIIRENIKQALEAEKTQLIKPMEEMALYRVGRLEERIERLEKEKELIQQENETLREAMKALPGPIEKVTEKLRQLEQIEANNLDLASQLEVVTQVKLNALKETETKEQMLYEKERTIKEGEEQIRKLEEQKKELEIRLKAEAEEQMKQLAEAWKKELEQAHRPWWKFW